MTLRSFIESKLGDMTELDRRGASQAITRLLERLSFSVKEITHELAESNLSLQDYFKELLHCYAKEPDFKDYLDSLGMTAQDYVQKVSVSSTNVQKEPVLPSPPLAKPPSTRISAQDEEEELDPKTRDRRAQAEEWRKRCPNAYEWCRNQALAYARDKMAFGINLIREELRWKAKDVEHSGMGYMFPNDISPYVSRMLIEDHPELAEFIKTKETKW